MRSVFEKLSEHLRRKEPCVLVSAVGGEGSAPRKTESHMLVDMRGYVCGTVGGGAVEGQSIVHAKKLLERKQSDLQVYELHEQAARDIGMICGGRVSVHFRYIPADDPQMSAIASQALSAFDEGIPAWLIIECTTHAVALYMDERAFGAEIPLELKVSLASTPHTLEQDGKRYYCEQLVHSDRVYVFGGGHVAQALVPVLFSVGFRCIVIEDREEFCRRELFPQAHDVRLLKETDWNSLLPIHKQDCICIMTRGHKNDLACQAFALRTQARYIGVIGSRRKVAAVNAKLTEMGFADAEIARIITPVGLEIGAVTPAEIAVSIAAQMIAHRARSRNIQKSCMS